MPDFVFGLIVGICSIVIVYRIYENHKEAKEEEKKWEEEKLERKIVEVAGKALQTSNPKMKIEYFGSLGRIEFRFINEFISAYNGLVEEFKEQEESFNVLLEELGYKGIWQKDKFVLIPSKRKE